MKKVRIYAKYKTDKRFGALDVAAGQIVGNLIYATIFEKEEGERVCKELNEQNPDYKFEVRNV